MAENTPIYLSVKDSCTRYDSSRAGLYKLLAQLFAEGKIPAIKNGRRTLIVTSVLDDHYASLPAAQIKAPANATSARPASFALPATPVATAAPAPRCRGRGRPPKTAPTPITAAPVQVTAPPLQPVEEQMPPPPRLTAGGRNHDC
jgi:hypothetical protein